MSNDTLKPIPFFFIVIYCNSEFFTQPSHITVAKIVTSNLQLFPNLFHRNFPASTCSCNCGSTICICTFYRATIFP